MPERKAYINAFTITNYPMRDRSRKNAKMAGGGRNPHHHHSLKEIWKKISAANILERVFLKIIRRTDPMGLFPNAKSSKRVL